MAEKITYLLGAGASAKAVPAVKDFNIKLKEFIEEIEKGAHLRSPKTLDSNDWPIIKSHFDKDAKGLFKEIINHKTVDTYARKLFLTHQVDKLKKLKALISVFLVCHQLQNGFDKRYDSFLSTILEKNSDFDIELPAQLAILTWNYDFQMEFAASNFFQEDSLEKIQTYLHQYPKSLNAQETDHNVFEMVKLNGTVGGFHPDENTFASLPIILKTAADYDYPNNEARFVMSSIFQDGALSTAVLGYYNFTKPNSSVMPNITYAWENSPFTNLLREKVKAIAIETNILVVIGYSFPTFNRKIDQNILCDMTHLKEVYIQSPSDSINGITERLYALMGYNKNDIGKNIVKVNLVPMESKELDDEFYIPFNFSKL